LNRYLIYLDQQRCIGCHGCEIHCKVNKNLPVGPILREITFEPLRVIKGVPRTEFHFRSCYHCTDPKCVKACPTGAMQKREDGIVFIEEEKCIGCMLCQKACPWQVPQYNPATNKAVKCDYCKDRIDAGLKPACVTKCATHALKFVELKPI